MTLHVLAFGIAKDIFGSSSTQIEVEDEAADVNGLKSALQQKFPRLQQLSSYMIAINNEYAQGEDKLRHTDEIAVIPPVSGG